MPYEIDYIPVGEGEKSGDAIALRFGNLTGSRDQQKVIVIDGGFKESGEQLVNHIKTYYGTDYVDLVILTHPDMDHASGLFVVLEQLRVGQLAMHRPWEHAADIKNLFKDGRITVSGLEEKLEKSLQCASDLEALANKKGVSIIEPFQGVAGYGGAVRILGPSRNYYEDLLALFRGTPEAKESLDIFAPVKKFAKEVIEQIQDFLHIDLIDDDEEYTTAENNTSAIVLFTIDGHKLLFTGDAGKTALHFAADYADTQSLSLTDLSLFGIPHHGSKRNLSSKVLQRIKGEKASISAPKESPKHPAKKITNALKKHGMKVFVVRGNILCHFFNAPTRNGWGPASEEPFYDFVEE